MQRQGSFAGFSVSVPLIRTAVGGDRKKQNCPGRWPVRLIITGAFAWRLKNLCVTAGYAGVAKGWARVPAFPAWPDADSIPRWWKSRRDQRVAAMPPDSNRLREQSDTGSLRAILARLGGGPTPANTPSTATPSSSELSQTSYWRMLPDRARARLGDAWRNLPHENRLNRDLARAFAGGFLIPLALVAFIAALWSPAVPERGRSDGVSQVASANGSMHTEPSRIGATQGGSIADATDQGAARGIAAFAVPPLATGQPSLIVPAEIVATAGAATAFPINVLDANLAPAGAVLMLSGLPEYAGLSPATPLGNGVWLVEIAAAPRLHLTMYSIPRNNHEINIALLNANRATITAAQTRVTTVNRPSDHPSNPVQALAAAPVPGKFATQIPHAMVPLPGLQRATPAQPIAAPRKFQAPRTPELGVRSRSPKRELTAVPLPPVKFQPRAVPIRQPPPAPAPAALLQPFPVAVSPEAKPPAWVTKWNRSMVGGPLDGK